jgi:hypothetical protein
MNTKRTKDELLDRESCGYTLGTNQDGVEEMHRLLKIYMDRISETHPEVIYSIKSVIWLAEDAYREVCDETYHEMMARYSRLFNTVLEVMKGVLRDLDDEIEAYAAERTTLTNNARLEDKRVCEVRDAATQATGELPLSYFDDPYYAASLDIFNVMLDEHYSKAEKLRTCYSDCRNCEVVLMDAGIYMWDLYKKKTRALLSHD